MKHLSLAAALLLTTLTYGQGRWSPYASVEEGIHISDVRPSYNYINLSVPASNAGMRMGAFYSHNDQLSGEVTLGLIGTGTPGRFSHQSVLAEFIGNYNVLTQPYGGINKFNFSFGLGSGLAESGTGRFGFSEHAVIGANMELKDLVPIGTLIMGMRYTQFVDDYIDGSQVVNSGNDGVLRFYTAIRLDGISRKADQAIAEAEALATKLQTEAKAAQEISEGLKKKLEATSKAHAEEVAQLTDALKACNDSLTNVSTNEEKLGSTSSLTASFYVIIGSFPSEELAKNYVNNLSLQNVLIRFEEELKTYRVVLSQHDSITDAVQARDKAKAISPNAWIAVY